MLPSSLLAFRASLLLPVFAASLTPVCVHSTEGYEVETLSNICKIFYGDLLNERFAANREVYGEPVLSLSSIPAIVTNKSEQINCLPTSGMSIESRVTNNHLIWGTSSIDAGCGIYNFTNCNTAFNPIGMATNTIGLASAAGLPVLLNLTRSTQISSSQPTGKPTATKPIVGSTALKTSDAAIIRGSGYTLLGVAFIFTWFL